MFNSNLYLSNNKYLYFYNLLNNDNNYNNI